MILHREYQQKSVDWMLARSGIPTASEFDSLLTPLFEIRKGDMPTSYLAKKLAEKWIGGPLPGFNTFDMEQGNILEEEAIPFFCLHQEKEIEQIGFMTTDDGRIGASPDGMFGDGTGIEIKCPEAHTHCRWLLNGDLPKEHAAQVHGSMFVADAEQWRFFSYRRHFPPFILVVERDQEIQDKIAEAMALFLTKLDSAFERLTTLNGGPPRRAVRPEQIAPPESTTEDVPH